MGRHKAKKEPTGRSILVALLASTAAVGSVLASPPGVAVAVEPTTHEGPAYDTTLINPSADKPQSKLFHVDGSWWALMTTGSDTTTRIHQLMPDRTWRDTGTVVDTRPNSTGDALWSAQGGKLYVASRTFSSDLQVRRFSYDTANDQWSADSGFPVEVDTNGSESTTIARDSTGRLWVTYTRDKAVWVAHSDVTGTQWTAGFRPNVPDTTIRVDDLSAVVSLGSSIGVMWSDQQSKTFHFAVHQDADPVSVWRVEDAGAVIPGPEPADDHINLKVSGGRLYAAVKTSNDDAGANAPLVGVLERIPGAGGTGTWKFATAGTVADDHTRPIVMVDETNGELYFLATAPGDDIVYKKTSLANPSFAPGRGTPFIDGARGANNVTGSKHAVTAETGMVVLAVEDSVTRYVHGELALGADTEPPPPDGADVSAPSVPQDVEASATADGVKLAWSQSTDDTGVAGYTVRRDGVVLAETTTTSYTDTAVTVGSSYSYTVQAFDAAGNRSGESVAATITVPDTPEDPPPSGEAIAFRAVTTTDSTDAARLTIATPDHQPGDLLLATVDFRGRRTVQSAPAGWQLVRQDANDTAILKATYYRIAGNDEPAHYTWSFDRTPLSAVGAVLAYSGVSASNPIQASGGQANPHSGSVTAPSVTTLSPQTLVVGLFAVNKRTSFTPPVGMTERSDTAAPGTVTYPVTGSTADLTQADPGPSGDHTAKTANAGKSVGQLIALNPGAVATPPPPPDEGDVTAPSVPEGVQASATAGRVELAWSASTDDTGVTGYTVRRDGVFLAETTTTSYTDADVTASTTYSYAVQAFDAAGNRSEESTATTATVPEEAPADPGDPPSGDGIVLRAVSTTNSSAGARLTIDAPDHQPGDLLLATVDFRGRATMQAPPAGWQLVRQDANDTAVLKATYYRVAGSDEPTSYTWTFDRTPLSVVGAVLAYSGVSTTNPIQASSGQANPHSGSVTAPSVTTLSPDTLVVGLFAVNKRTTFTPPTGMTEHSDTAAPDSVQYPVTGSTADLTLVDPGPSGNHTATTANAGKSIGQLIALAPATG